MVGRLASPVLRIFRPCSGCSGSAQVKAAAAHIQRPKRNQRKERLILSLWAFFTIPMLPAAEDSHACMLSGWQSIFPIADFSSFLTPPRLPSPNSCQSMRRLGRIYAFESTALHRQREEPTQPCALHSAKLVPRYLWIYCFQPMIEAP
jgi:hypothetical protein